MTRPHLEPETENEFYFQWHITERCNLSCKHCYQNVNDISELPLNDLLAIINKMENALLKWNKQGTLSLTGGEPLFRKNDLYALMDRLDTSKSLCYYDILTNGSYITESEAEKLITHPHLRRIQLSLEGACATVNDEIRGPGSFDSTIEAIRNLRKYNNRNYITF